MLLVYQYNSDICILSIQYDLVSTYPRGSLIFQCLKDSYAVEIFQTGHTETRTDQSDPSIMRTGQALRNFINKNI